MVMIFKGGKGMVLDVVSMIISVLVGSTGLSVAQNLIEKRVKKQENDEVTRAVADLIGKATDDDIVNLMLKNVAELREYYVISKSHANKSYVSALIACIFGFILYITGIVLMITTSQNIIIYTTTAGTIIEIVSGLFFWLYKTTIGQLNLYHERLGTTEKYLIAIQLVDRVSEDRHDEMYKHIMECVLIDNRIKEEKNLKENNDNKINS
ncbi:MAG: hypothetical protein K0S18_1318 [Anaerocolumna sp.]|jgi:hypothetical protein|nr:hypothetical protein [Anaerocolumna sp.]